jgi:hypothetical protein
MQGLQGVRNSFPYNDKYLKCRADKNRYNIGTHAEDFVIPMTSYAHDPDQLGKEDQQLYDKYDEMEAQLKYEGPSVIPEKKRQSNTDTRSNFKEIPRHGIPNRDGNNRKYIYIDEINGRCISISSSTRSKGTRIYRHST